MDDVLGDGLLTASGETWSRHRRLVQPLFAARRLGDFAGHMTTAADRVLDGWRPGWVFVADPAPGCRVVPEPNATLRPSDGLPMVLRPVA